MKHFFSFNPRLKTSRSRTLSGWLLAALLLGAAPAARAQCAFTTSVTPSGPLTLCPGGSTTLTATAVNTSPGLNIGTTGPNNDVNIVLPLPNGQTLVGGRFNSYGSGGFTLVRINADGSRDATFNPAIVIGIVFALAVEPDGQILVGGNITGRTSTGNNESANLLRLNADGTRDFTFNAGGTNFNSTVLDLALEPDGQIVVGGFFDMYNGVAAGRLIRLNADGTRDTGFNAGGSAFGSSVSAVALEPDGQILVGGGFGTYNGVAVSARLMRLNADGSRDATFNSGGAGFDEHVYDLVLEPDGQILVGGAFSVFNGALNTPDRLVRLNADGTRDTGFNGTNAGFSGSTSGSTGGTIIRRIALQPDGKVLAGGVFTTYNGAPTNTPDGLVRLNADGTRDTGFNGTNAGFSGLEATIIAVAVQADGQVLVGGSFSSYNGDGNVPDYLTRLRADGSFDNTPVTPAGTTFAWSNGATGATLSVTQPGLYQVAATSGSCTTYSNTVRVDAAPTPTVSISPAGSLSICDGATQTLTATATLPGFNAGGAGFNAAVNAVLALPDGKTLAGGNFTTYNGTTAGYLVRLNADGSRDATFNAGGVGFDGGVFALALEPDGQVLVGGNFSLYNGAAAGRLVRLNTDGSRDATFNAGGASFTNTVFALALESDGQVLVGGAFLTYNGVNTPDFLVRLNANGSLDSNFNTGGAGFNAIVRALVVKSDGQVLAGGDFTTYNGSAAGRLARLNADGTRDATFNTTTGFGDTVNALALESDGQVLVGGFFLTYNGVTIPKHLARLNTDGSRDATFNSGGTGFDGGSVASLALKSDGQVLVGGYFTTYNGSTAGRLVRLNADGTRDAGFNGSNAGFANFVLALALEADGQVVAGGNFASYNGADVPDGLTRLNADGTANTTATAAAGATFAWSTGATGASIVVSRPGAYSATATAGGCTTGSNVVQVTETTPATVVVTPAGPLTVCAGGSLTLTAAATEPGTTTPVAGATFVWSNGATGPSITVTEPGLYQATATSGGGCLAYSNLVQVNAPAAVAVRVTPVGPVSLPSGGSETLTAAAVRPGFNVGGAGLGSFSSGVSVQALALEPDGQVLAGGSFSRFNGQAIPTNLARFNADGTRDASFNSGGSGFNDPVYALAVLPGGKLLAGGFFFSYNGTNVSGRLVRLNANGSLDATFNAGGAGFNGTVRALAVQPDGRILVGGEFTQYNRVNVPGRLVRLNADGTLDQSFNAGSAGFDNTVHALALEPDGQVLVGGFFTSYNGLANTPDYLVRLNADGTRDLSFNGAAAGLNERVFALSVQPDGRVLVGGYFTQYNGVNVPDLLIRLNADGSHDASFNTGGSGFSGSVWALGVQPDGKVLVGGNILSYNGASIPDQFVRLNADGTRDLTFGPVGPGTRGFSSTVFALALQPDAQVVVGGTFGSYNGADIPDLLTRLTATGTRGDVDAPLTGATYAWTPGGSTGSTLNVSTAGTYSATATDPASGCSFTSNAVVVTASGATDLVVSTLGQSIPAGTYNNVTVTGTGAGTLQGNITVNGALLVETGGQLSSGCFEVTGPGSFTLQAGASLSICSPAGLSTTPGAGMVQVTGTRSFSSDATYTYNGTQPQVTGSALPGQVRELVTTNANTVTLSQPLSVRQRLVLSSTGNVDLSGQSLTLLSDATGTALVVNSGTGVVNGTAIVQRFISPAQNPGPGYRHFSAPVASAPVSQLGTSGTTPVVNPDYNGSATPGSVSPFPTVFGYQQLRLDRTTNNLSAFDKGWFSPMTLGETMQVGAGYTFNVPGSRTVSFSGTLNTGTYPLALERNPDTSPTAAAAGWQLVGNPYPAPLDWRLVVEADRMGLTGAMYVFESRDTYTGAYRSYTNGIGVGGPFIASGQAFFVRVAPGQTTATLTLRDAQRVTSYATQATFRRSTADTRPQLRLELQNGSSSDAVYVYVQAGATAGLDPGYDAEKLRNTTGLNVAATASTGQSLSIQGLGTLGTTATVVPLTVQVPQAGSYSLAVGELLNFAPNATVTLRDDLLGTSTLLTGTTRYSFQTTGTTANGRFYLELRSTGALSTASQVLSQQVQLYPNPAHGQFRVLLPASVASAQLTLLNALGQTVRTLNATGTSTLVDASGLAQGVYTLRVQAGAATATKRLVIE
ncbi:T9SS type A sorting domain-containing protein [Hymenobacter sp. BT175]|uniref:T9SS type A sorting domain-containing protein n=1 Tax=Hymenobacter translucens TaxID=2886507 RepID=UPI001D0E934D|nr:T9SS type A sorting domain-containing protein [Hymenobacter translucens]MCC2548037.1 T9SS type A sorting domain-containing protein [Hymenobacter translucens]